ncbi:MAG: NfeD family protein [Planctomycetia bacterium]|nr:NfeD family protein [Planctomycetia bacterium]
MLAAVGVSWAWIILLLIGGILFVVAEILIPSYGMLTLLAISSFLASIVLAFMKGQNQGLIITLVIVLMTPALIYAAMRVWPHTPIARRIILPGPERVGTAGDLAELDPEELEGKIAVTKTVLRPAGKITLGDRVIDCVTEGDMVEEGEKVRILQVEGNRVVVRPVEQADA